MNLKLALACSLMGGYCAAVAETQSSSPGSDAASPAAATAASSVPETTSSAGLAEIVVTAQRRSERLQDVPITVTAVTGAQLESSGIQSTQDLSVLTPGLTSPQIGGFALPHIRGVGSSSNGPGLEAPVATYIDGVYIAAAPSTLLTLVDVDRLEVLKGPQGTLFGRNATGGLIQIITKDPSQTTSGTADVTYGNYQDVSTDVYATTGLTETLAADLALRYEYQGEGYGRNLNTGNETERLNHDLTARSKFLFEPTESLQLRLALDYEDRLSSLDVQHLGTQYPGTFDNPGFGGPYPLGGPYDINDTFDPVTRLKAGGASVRVNYGIDDINIQSITAFRQSQYSFPTDLDLLPVNLLSLVGNSKDQQFSEELQVSSGKLSRLSWVAGIFYFQSDDQWAPINTVFGPSVLSPVPGVPVTLSVNDEQNTNSLAGYAQATYEVFDSTHLTAGLRYTDERKDISGEQAFVVGGVVASTTGVPTAGLDIPSAIKFSKFNYRVELDHKFAGNLLAYVSYTTGFKSGGYNLDVPSNPPYAPETIGAAEVGIKSEFFDRHLRLNGAVFDYSYKNIQVGRFQDSQETIYNGAGARMYGLDLDGKLLVGNGISFTGGFSYIHDRFTSFPDADFIVPIAGCVPFPGGVCSGSAAGKELPFTPTTTFDLGTDFYEKYSFGAIAANLTYYRSASWYAAPDNVGRQSAYSLLNSSASWTDREDALFVRLWVKNLGKKVYANSLVEANQGLLVGIAPPRTYGITVGYNF